MASEDLVEILFDARRDGASVAPTHDVSSSDEGLATQLAVSRKFATELADSVAGWKVGMTSGSSRDRMGADFRPFGFLLRSRVKSTGALLELGTQVPYVLEPEICLIVGSPLQGRVGEAEARAAIRSVAPAFEIAELRTEPALASDGLLIADGLANWGIVVGADTNPIEFDRPISMELSHDGRPVTRATTGEDVELDDPYVSLARLVRLLSRFGLGVNSGDHVITGSLVTRPAMRGEWTASFDQIGAVTAEIR